MAQIITVDFRERKVIDCGLNRFGEAARRCSAAAAKEPDEICADTLRRVAARYRRAAEGGGA